MATLSDYLKGLSTGYRQSSIYPTLGSAISSAPVEYSQYASPWQNFAVALSKSFLGSGLSSFGEARAKQFDTNATNALRELASGREYTGGGLADDDLEQIRAAADLFKLERAQERAALAEKLGLEVTAEGAKELARQRAGITVFDELSKRAGQGGEIGKVDPNSALAVTPIGQKIVDIQNKEEDQALARSKDEFDREQRIAQENRQNEKDKADAIRNAVEAVTIKDPNGQAFGNMGPAFTTMMERVGETSAASDGIFKVSMARIIDPVGAIGKDAAALAEQAIPLYEQYFGSLKKYVGQDGTIDPKGKIEILRNVAGRVKPIGEGYNMAMEREASLLKDRGIDPESVFKYVPKYQPFDEPSVRQRWGIMPTLDEIKGEFKSMLASGVPAKTAQEAIIGKYGNLEFGTQ